MGMNDARTMTVATATPPTTSIAADSIAAAPIDRNLGAKLQHQSFVPLEHRSFVPLVYKDGERPLHLEATVAGAKPANQPNVGTAGTLGVPHLAHRSRIFHCDSTH